MKFLGSISSLILILLILTDPIQAQSTSAYGPDHYEIDRDLKSELNLVYIGASWCAPCRRDSLKQTLEELKLVLYDRAKEENMNYSVIGVSNDQSIQEGLELLNSTGYFDEVIIGKKWINSGSIDFIWDQKEVKPAVPQIIVFNRSLKFEEGIIAGEKNIMVRKVGVREIDQWFEDGAPFNND